MYAWSSTTGASAKQICIVAESVCTSKQLLCPVLWNFYTVSAFQLICLLCVWFTLLGSVGVSHNLQSQSLSVFALLSWMDQITLFFCCLMTFFFRQPFLYLLILLGLENSGDLMAGYSTSTKISWQISVGIKLMVCLHLAEEQESSWLLCLQKQQLVQHCLPSPKFFFSFYSNVSYTRSEIN